MTHTYNITNMTCSSCEAKIKDALFRLPQVTAVETDIAKKEVAVIMQSHISTSVLQDALEAYPKYQLSEKQDHTHAVPDESKSWLQTYKPLLLVFAFITGVAIITAYHDGFQLSSFMSYFMAGFFLVFSFFKLLDIQGFADSYSSYDLLASRFRQYGLVYPFIELSLGIAYLIIPASFALNLITLIIMLFSSIGVINSVMQKRRIRCACLGAVFNLPMSTVTIVEDLLMAGMALIMLTV